MPKAYLEPYEIELLKKAAPNFRDRLLIHLIYHSACRVTEALRLTPENVDFTQGVIIIQRLKSRQKLAYPQCGVRLGRHHAFCPGCGQNVTEPVRKALEHRRMRFVPLDKETLDMLREHIECGGLVSRNDSMLIFGINRHRAWQVIKELAQRAGLPRLVHPKSGREHGVSSHRLRDAFVVMAVKQNDSGDGLRLLQEHLGHSSFDTTARYRKISYSWLNFMRYINLNWWR